MGPQGIKSNETDPRPQRLEKLYMLDTLFTAAAVRRESNDFLLPAMITLLNERGAWQLRAAFFQHIALVAAHAGPAGLEAFLLPILEQVVLCLC